MKKNSEYEKMPKNLKGLDLDEKAFSELGKVQWVVTEKIHGANFSFVYEGRKLLFAKRKDYLQWTDDFFGFQAVAAALEEQVLRLFEQLSTDVPADRYIIYGELFGGAYPHPGVAAAPGVQAIQTGVYYSPDVRFCAFDIAIESDEDCTKQYLDYKTAMAYFDRFGIFYAKPLFTGKLNEALAFNTRIDSVVPSMLQLPAISPNLVEGVVIKPLVHSGLKNLDARPVVKLKNPEFDEEKKFHEAEKWSFVPSVTSLSEELGFLVAEMSHYINENRLSSVLSKTGRLDFSSVERMKEIRDEFLRDVLTDFNGNNNRILDELLPAQQEWVTARVQAQINAFINSHR